MRRGVLLIVSLAAWAASTSTVNNLVSLVETGLRKKQSDSHIAGAVRKCQLTDRLDWRTIEELESAGAGPKTVEALEMLLEESRGMPSPSNPPFSNPPPPDAAEQDRVLQAAAVHSLDYAASLPDFICTEMVRRYEDLQPKEKPDWSLKDTLTLKLSYFSHAEDYRLVAINGHPTYRTFEEVGGAVSEGEFGSLLISLFRGADRKRFAWDHWTTLRGRPALVYRFRIPLEESEYSVQYARGGVGPVSAHSGQSGFIEVDRATSRVLRIYAVAEDLPADFPVINVSMLVDYDFVEISGRQFLLPVHARVRMGTHWVQTRNEVSFEDYRKFGSDTTITFR